MPDLDIPVGMCLEVLTAADYLGLDSESSAHKPTWLDINLTSTQASCGKHDMTNEGATFPLYFAFWRIPMGTG